MSNSPILGNEQKYNLSKVNRTPGGEETLSNFLIKALRTTLTLFLFS